MRRLDENPIDPEIAAQLDAIDATLAGEPVDPQYAELAELALLLAAERPASAPEFAAEMDARVARRFAGAPAAAGAGDRGDAERPARRIWRLVAAAGGDRGGSGRGRSCSWSRSCWCGASAGAVDPAVSAGVPSAGWNGATTPLGARASARRRRSGSATTGDERGSASACERERARRPVERGGSAAERARRFGGSLGERLRRARRLAPAAQQRPQDHPVRPAGARARPRTGSTTSPRRCSTSSGARTGSCGARA